MPSSNFHIDECISWGLAAGQQQQPVLQALPILEFCKDLPVMSSNTFTNVGHGLAKVLGIKLHYRNPQGLDDLSRGESVYSVSSADTFIEREPSSWEWIQQITPNGPGLLRWAYNLFPFVHWIGRYNLQWLYGDLVAGTP
ncbi:MAG: hypothetical protein Q9222_000444 [Ikaeria aurantiellina]